MMIFTKLNNDSSWLWETIMGRIVVDPWFTESQIDAAPWFSRQYHVSAQPPIASLGHVDFIFISHPFTDHCNEDTLLQFDKDIPLITTDSIASKISKWKHFKKIHTLRDSPIKIERVRPNSFLDLVHDGFLFYIEGKNILYAPHGLNNYILSEKVDVLISTTTRYHLPFWLGGTINLGVEKLKNLIVSTSCKVCLTTHDEKKIGKGLVERFADKTYTSSFEDSKIVSLREGECYTY